MTKRHARMIQMMRDNAEEIPIDDEEDDIGSDLVSKLGDNTYLNASFSIVTLLHWKKESEWFWKLSIQRCVLIYATIQILFTVFSTNVIFLNRFAELI